MSGMNSLRMFLCQNRFYSPLLGLLDTFFNSLANFLIRRVFQGRSVYTPDLTHILYHLVFQAD
jgi:hypothetical protein